MPAINRVEPFTAMADVYERAGFGRYATDLIGHILELAFDLEWEGRTYLDLACRAGDAALSLSGRGLRATGIDSSPAMIRLAHQRADTMGLGAEFYEGDLREYKPSFAYDLVTCLGGSLNYLATLRDLEAFFRVVQNAVAPGKLLAFDLRTIQGLALSAHNDRVVAENGDDVLILAHDTFNYETLQLTTRFTIFNYDEGQWNRSEETHILRGYPVQVILKQLSQSGFKLLRTLTPNMEPVENMQDVSQLLFVARKEA